MNACRDNLITRRLNHLWPVFLGIIVLSCDADILRPPPGLIAGEFETTGVVQSKKLNEISGIQALNENEYLVHNDDGKARVTVVTAAGEKIEHVYLNDGKEREWEDLTIVRRGEQKLLVIGEIGDNQGNRKSVRLHFANVPAPMTNGLYSRQLENIHTINLTYPDGPRDAESLVWDEQSEQLLIISKRDSPPRIYAIDLEQALSDSAAVMSYVGDIHNLRPPTTADTLNHKKRGQYFSQPTGMDISPNGKYAAIITYRSLYVYQRQKDQTWPEALMGKPTEFIGPQGTHQEAVGFDINGHNIIVTGERKPAFIFSLDFEQHLLTPPAE